MNYEQKYNEMLDAARYWHDVSEGDIPAVLEEIFPELAESEDDRMRITIIDFIKNLEEENESYLIFGNTTTTDMIAWLEKQCPKENNANEETNAPTGYGKYVDECLNEASKHFFSEEEDKYSVADLFYAGVRCGKSWLEKQGDNASGECNDTALEKQLKIWFEKGKCSGIDDVIFHPQKYGLEKQGDANKEYWRGYRVGKKEILELEKQGEQKVSEYDIVKTIKERIIEHFDNHLIIDKCFSIGGLKDDILKIINDVKFAKQGEQNPTECIKFSNEFENQISHLLLSVLNREYEYNEGFVKYVAQSLLGYAKNELKPIEWSEEDELKKNAIISLIKEIQRQPLKRLEDWTGYVDWLESVKYRTYPQLKQEWSEEDEIKIKSIIAFLKSPSLCAMDGNKDIIDENVKYLKSLKDRVQPKQTWSEEDEKIRQTIINEFEQCSEWCCSNGLTKEDCINWLNRQKYFEWSDEDNENMNSLCVLLDQMVSINAIGNEHSIEYKNWLKSLKGRVQPQPKQEWSEEDEKILDLIIQDYEAASRSFCGHRGKLDWLKALKERYTWKQSSELDETSYRVGIKRVLENPESYGLTKYNWKPSDGQIKALKDACDKSWEPDGLDPLYTLYEDLKKLKGE